MPPSHIFSSKDNSFVSEILQITTGRGVDVVVNTLSGDLFFESCKCVAEGGSMIDFSKWDSTHESFDRNILGENRNFYSFDIVTMLQQKPSLAQRSVQHYPHLLCSSYYFVMSIVLIIFGT
jgi:NADPH:quinone reductase-like Zn-dependent oxidoreductase